MKIRLQRQLGYHLVQTYIPSVVFVAISWLSLFVSPESIPGKLASSHTYIYAQSVVQHYLFKLYSFSYNCNFRSRWYVHDDTTNLDGNVWSRETKRT